MMKKLLVLSLFLFGAVFALDAQIKTPAPSPFCKVEQKVGLTDVTIEYSRPGMKGREIFGSLVPYGAMWRAGANKNTKISFSDDVTINGSELEKGTYAIFIKPAADSWEFYFYTDSNNSGTPKEWDDAKVALKTSSDVQAMPMPMETYTIDVGDLKSDGAVISFLWENVWVPLELGLSTDDAVMASIEKTMAGPDWYGNYQAARYYLENGKDLDKAMTWMKKSIDGEGGKKFWVQRQMSLLQAKMGDYKGAMATAKKSMELAEAAGNNDYIRMNKESLMAWKKMK